MNKIWLNGLKWLKILFVDLIFYGCLIGWVFFGVQGLGNIFTFATVVMVLMLLFCLTSKKYLELVKGKKHMTDDLKGFRTYHLMTDFGALFILLYFGHIITGTIYFLKFVLGQTLREVTKEKEENEEN